MISPPENVTDVVLASEYQYVSDPWPVPWSWTPGPHDAIVSNSHMWKPRVPEMRYPGASRSRRYFKRARRDDWDDRPATPPMTPYIGRLESPELEPMKCSGSFCDCCMDEYYLEEERYFDERGKMDCQGMSRLFMGGTVVVVVESEMTKPC